MPSIIEKAANLSRPKWKEKSTLDENSKVLFSFYKSHHHIFIKLISPQHKV
jgi:hypothetical protein